VEDNNELVQELQNLREQINSLQLATINLQQLPEVSYAPCIWQDNACYLFLSDLAQHTHNLKQNPAISLMMIEDESRSRNMFARRRLVLQGTALKIERSDPLFKPVIAEFHHRFGEVMDLIEPLQDFNLFQIKPESGRFIKGFGQAFELGGENLDQLQHINPARK
jgi:putative heme iron utilization protein